MMQCIFFVLLILFSSPAFAGYDAASVPDDKIPWSGYWWPTTLGELALGYAGHPSPAEKYDAYMNGYYPGSVTHAILDREYNPNAYGWYGFCDEWAAASILESEPNHPGDPKGILFRVGDKKGLLAIHYLDNVVSVVYGNRYEKEPNDFKDIYPGGAKGFHQTLISYIAYQGLPIIMDLDPGPQIWNHPAYRYEMSWEDVANKRHVTCQVWLADDNVSPDVIGTVPFHKTYTYWLAINDKGEILDEPGEWEGDSIEDHPDFMWFPSFSNTSHLLNPTALEEILNSSVTGADDQFEDNDRLEQATAIAELKKNRFYPAMAKDDDWYRVTLQQGDDFMVYARTSFDDLTVKILNAQGIEIGTSYFHSTWIDQVPQTGVYYVHVLPIDSQTPSYDIEFYQSPSETVPHTAFLHEWETSLLLVNAHESSENIRLNLLDHAGNRVAVQQLTIESGKQQFIELNRYFSLEERLKGRRLKVINIGGEHLPSGFYTYEQPHQLVSLPLHEEPSTRVYIPHMAISDYWWTGIAVANPNIGNPAMIQWQLYSPNGSLIHEMNLELGKGQTLSVVAQELWNESLLTEGGWVELISDYPIQGCVLWGNLSNTGVAGIPLLKPSQTGTLLYVPHIAVNSEWWTGAALINPNDQDVSLRIQGYSSAGKIVGSDSIIIPPHGKRNGIVEELFKNVWSQNVAWIEIIADRPIGGFVLYGQTNHSRAASLTLPTSGDMRTSMRIHDLPKGTDSWTGLTLLNPNNQKVDIRATPYDQNGTRLTDEGSYLWYNPPDGLCEKCKVAGMIEDIFPGLPPQTAYLDIDSETPIFGFGIFSIEKTGKLDIAVFESN